MDAFVFFDESRCRGADMKLKPSAQATLTIGPGMCKDKLMQAAGRMRKLAYGQTLVLFVPAELVSKIQNADTTLSTLHVLNWVMHNTVKATADGLPAWASQGSHFCTTENPEARLIDENLLLEGLYGGTIVECSIYNHVVSGQAKDTHRVLQLGHEPGRKASEMMMELSEGRAKKFGSDIPIKSSGLDEECERELENERELEREAERQYARYAPNAPRKWEFKELLKSRSIRANSRHSASCRSTRR
jgi:hypothetical protein